MIAFWKHAWRALVVVFVAILVSSLLGLTDSAAGAQSKLVDIRAAHYPGYDRIVFEFEGPVPDVARVRWATDLRMDFSALRANVQGNAFIHVRFQPAIAHELEPPQESTFGPARRAFALPNIAHVVLLGDFEADVSVGIGLMKRTRILRTIELRNPSRFVIHVATDFPKGKVKVFFIDEEALIDGRLPYVAAVTRKVPKGGRPKGAMQRLYAGPTQAELDAGLRFVASGTRGFRDLWINDRGVARVTVRGPCDSGGSADGTVASQIMPTLRSRPAVDWVKIYDKRGVTEEPWGRTDSIPFCLEP
jgi:hypothetical protein